MASPVERLMRRVQHMVGVGRTSAPINDAGAAQSVQIQTYAGRQVDGVPVCGMFGLSSVPPVGSDVTFVAIAGDSGAVVVVATAHQGSRPKNGPAGSTKLYDQVGSFLLLNNDKTAQLQAAANVTIKTPDTFVTGNLHVGSGASGSFTSGTGQIVTVKDGIITNIF